MSHQGIHYPCCLSRNLVRGHPTHSKIEATDKGNKVATESSISELDCDLDNVPLIYRIGQSHSG